MTSTATRRATWAVLATSALVFAGCEDRQTHIRAIAPPEDDATHASVVAHADAVNASAVEDLSCAPPPMNAMAEPERAGTGAPDGATSESELEATDPAKQPEGSGAGEQKAKAAPREMRPHAAPTGIRPPLSAAEAAEREHESVAPPHGATPATPSSAQLPAPASPTAPAETSRPR